VGFFLYLAQSAVRDCPSGLYTYDNCLWLWLREQSGLPQSKLLRSMVLQLVGLTLVVGLYLTYRYVFPRKQDSVGRQATESRE